VHASIVLLVFCLLVGCSPPRYRASLVVVASDVTTDDHVRYVGGKTIAQLLVANAFWREFVIPRMPENLSSDPRVQAGLVVSSGDDRTFDGKIIAPLDVELSYGGEAAFNVICEAYSAYMTGTSRDRLNGEKERLAAAREFAGSALGSATKTAAEERVFELEKNIVRAERDLIRGFILDVRKP
jgi:hypothetical protein